MKYLIIDGNNLAIRASFANSGLENHLGISTAVHFGVFNSVINLRNRFGDHQFLIVWDGKSKRRMEESTVGVDKGLVPSAYKANRKVDEQPKQILDFIEQSPYLKRGIGQAGIPQIRMMGYEADDVIAAYCKLLRKDNEIVVVTSDHDFLQILHPNVSLWDGMNMESITYQSWTEKTGLKPYQHIECGGLCGDTGDNIFGIPGWGEKTSLKWIKKFGTAKAVIEHFRDKYKDERELHPDLKSDTIKELKNLKTKKEKDKYPEVTSDMPYTGVAFAFENGWWKPKKKSGVKLELMAAMFGARVELARSLKSMDDDIEGLPDIKGTEPNRERILEYFDYYAIETLKDEVGILV